MHANYRLANFYARFLWHQRHHQATRLIIHIPLMQYININSLRRILVHIRIYTFFGCITVCKRCYYCCCYYYYFIGYEVPTSYMQNRLTGRTVYVYNMDEWMHIQYINYAECAERCTATRYETADILWARKKFQFCAFATMHPARRC